MKTKEQVIDELCVAMRPDFVMLEEMQRSYLKKQMDNLYTTIILPMLQETYSRGYEEAIQFIHNKVLNLAKDKQPVQPVNDMEF